VNQFQKIWLEAYKSFLQAASPLGELAPSDYSEAREHADAVLNSLIKAGDIACN